MRYVDEFRDPSLAEGLLQSLRDQSTRVRASLHAPSYNAARARMPRIE